MGDWQTISKSNIYENAWIEVSHHEVINPSGNNGIYGVVRFHNKAIGILAVDEHLNIVLVGQDRYPLNAYSWEIPEGGCPIGEDNLSAAKRELKEETGLEAKDISICTVKNGTNGKMYIYHCEEWSGEVKLNFEHSDYKWVEYDKLDELSKTTPDLKNFVRQALDIPQGY